MGENGKVGAQERATAQAPLTNQPSEEVDMAFPDLTPTDRFWRRVLKTDTCWLWTGARNSKGYGHFVVNGRLTKATHFSVRFHGSDIPPGHVVCHTCDNPLCVRPDHLFTGTHLDNARDKIAKGRNYTRSTSGKCLKGLHDLTEGAFYVTSKGFKLCKVCHRAYQREYRAAHRAS